MTRFPVLLGVGLFALFCSVSCFESEDVVGLSPLRQQTTATSSLKFFQFFAHLKTLSGAGRSNSHADETGSEIPNPTLPSPGETSIDGGDVSHTPKQLGNFVVKLLNGLGNTLNGGKGHFGLISGLITLLKNLLGGILGFGKGGGLLGGLLGGKGGGLLGGLLGGEGGGLLGGLL